MAVEIVQRRPPPHHNQLLAPRLLQRMLFVPKALSSYVSSPTHTFFQVRLPSPRWSDDDFCENLRLRVQERFDFLIIPSCGRLPPAPAEQEHARYCEFVRALQDSLVSIPAEERVFVRSSLRPDRLPSLKPPSDCEKLRCSSSWRTSWHPFADAFASMKASIKNMTNLAFTSHALEGAPMVTLVFLMVPWSRSSMFVSSTRPSPSLSLCPGFVEISKMIVPSNSRVKSSLWMICLLPLALFGSYVIPSRLSVIYSCVRWFLISFHWSRQRGSSPRSSLSGIPPAASVQISKQGDRYHLFIYC